MTQKLLGALFFLKHRHNSAFGPSPGMIRDAKIKILAKLEFTKTQNCLEGLETPKMTLEKIRKIYLRKGTTEAVE